MIYNGNMALKFTRTSFVYAFTAFFAFIATMGEGLHFLPGMGHSCEHLHDCMVSCPTAADHDDSGGCPSSLIAHSNYDSDGVHNAANCEICKYFSLVKSCLLAIDLAGDCVTVTERLPVYSPLLESRFIGSYHSRAPPSV